MIIIQHWIALDQDHKNHWRKSMKNHKCDLSSIFYFKQKLIGGDEKSYHVPSNKIGTPPLQRAKVSRCNTTGARNAEEKRLPPFPGR